MADRSRGPDEPTAPLDGHGARSSFGPPGGEPSSGTTRAPRGQGSDDDSVECEGELIGPYRLLSVIGEGGFGTVWLAERREPFVQRVALKVIKPGMDSRAVVARFEQERQALAMMNHPNIARVFDGGLTPRGRPYFAMEFVKGESITAFCDARRLGVKERLELFAQVCDAIQHAHSKGVIHRDIKPSNVLACEVDGNPPTLKVIDFGVAKAITQPLTDKTLFTEAGQMIGTPTYMSPEQADPTSAGVDTRTDIYSLGVLLYEVVTGAPPFDPSTLRAKGYGEFRRIIREEDPPSPSARLSTILTKDEELASRIERARGTLMRELTRELRSELEWIPLKAMRKEPQSRYQTAMHLGEDIKRYLAGRPLEAGPESSSYRFRKWLRRHRVAVRAALAVGLAVGVGASLPTASAWLAEQRLVARMHAFEPLAQEPDPAVVTDAAARERIKATGKPWKIRHIESGIVMLLVPPGEFTMGSPATERERAADETEHARRIRAPFYLSETEVSVAAWRKVTGEEPEAPGAASAEGGRLPIESASWDEIHERFIRGSRGFFRLPSEAEWEYACRAGTSTPFSFGETISTVQANFDGRRPHGDGARGERRTGPVPCGTMPPNPWGFREMHGNSWEWVEDAYGPYPKGEATEEPARGDNGSMRVLRGGGWSYGASDARSARRDSNKQGANFSKIGFRVARGV